MNQDRIQGVLKQTSGKAKQWWGRLTGNPGAIAAGARDLFAGRNQEQRGFSKQEADRQIEEFMNRNRNWWNLPGR